MTQSTPIDSIPLPAPAAWRRHHRRRGFTLIEILTVITIIALLVALSVYGFRHLNRSSKDQVTKAALQSLRAWGAELEAATAGSAGKRGYDLLNDSTSTIAGYKSVTTKYGSAGASPLPAAVNLGDVNSDGIDISSATRGRYGQPVKQTAIAMGKLMSLPAVKAAIDKMPANRFLMKAYGPPLNKDMIWNPYGYDTSGNPNPIPGTSPSAYPGPVLLDGYSNPIVFVPAAGLTEVDRADQLGFTIDSTSVGPIRARDDKPFWASAGADGKFTGPPGGASKKEGDDNIYSFDQ